MAKIGKIIFRIVAIVLIFILAYFVVNSVLNLFEGYSLGGAIENSWHNITHLFGMIKEKPIWDVEIPFTNVHITLGYANAPH